jgi:hypothetical protein
MCGQSALSKALKIDATGKTNKKLGVLWRRHMRRTPLLKARLSRECFPLVFWARVPFWTPGVTGAPSLHAYLILLCKYIGDVGTTAPPCTTRIGHHGNRCEAL